MKDIILSMTIKKQGDRYSSWCPELDVASEGDTIEEAKVNLKEAVQCHVEVMIENNDLDELADRLGITKEQCKKSLLVSETISGTLEITI